MAHKNGEISGVGTDRLRVCSREQTRLKRRLYMREVKKINKILIAVAFSDQSEGHFLYAAYLADLTKAELFVLSVINRRDIDAAAVFARLAGSSALTVDQFTQIEIKRRTDKVEETLKRVDLGNIQHKTLVRIGNPFEVVMEVINELKVDIVVMGTRGAIVKDEQYSILTGSVAEKVFRHSPVPVLSVRGDL
jgi:nucleotide-binding universal stress UspA family protein